MLSGGVGMGGGVLSWVVVCCGVVERRGEVCWGVGEGTGVGWLGVGGLWGGERWSGGQR